MFVIVIVVFFRLQFVGSPPIWDGHQYFQSLINAVNKVPFSVYNFNLENHNTAGYFLIQGLFQLLDLGNYQIAQLVNVGMVAMAAFMFFKIIQSMEYKEISSVELVLMTLVFAFDPLFVAGAININPDFATLVFFIASLYSLLYLKKRYFLLFGLLLSFTKEFGAVLYVILAFLWIVLINRNHPKRLINALMFMFPPTLVVFFFIYKKFFKYEGYYTNYTLGSTLKKVLVFTPDKSVYTKLIQIFIINFHWILLLLILFHGLKLIFSFITKKNSIINFDDKEKYVFKIKIVLTFCFIGFTFASIQYREWSSPRYIAPTLFFVIFFGFLSLRGLIKSGRIRVSILVVILICFTGQIYYSIDPVGNSILGTFNFGKHKMMRITSLTGEGACKVSGRDQIIYNTQYTMIDKLMAEIFRNGLLKENIVLFSHFDNFYYEVAPWDPVSFKRTYRAPPHYYAPQRMYIYTTFPSKTYFKEQLMKIEKDKWPQRAYYINFPWCEDEMIELAVLNEFFIQEKSDIVELNGYQLKVYQMYLKDEWRVVKNINKAI